MTLRGDRSHNKPRVGRVPTSPLHKLFALIGGEVLPRGLAGSDYYLQGWQDSDRERTRLPAPLSRPQPQEVTRVVIVYLGCTLGWDAVT